PNREGCPPKLQRRRTTHTRVLFLPPVCKFARRHTHQWWRVSFCQELRAELTLMTARHIGSDLPVFLSWVAIWVANQCTGPHSRPVPNASGPTNCLPQSAGPSHTHRGAARMTETTPTKKLTGCRLVGAGWPIAFRQAALI